MNGELGEIYNRLIKIETTMDERWRNQNIFDNDLKDSINWQFKDVNGKLTLISDKVSSLNCLSHREKLDGLEKNIGRAWALSITLATLCSGGFFFLVRLYLTLKG